MERRTVVVFWVASSAAVALLGGSVATIRRLIVAGDIADVVVLDLSLAGLGLALFVAGRIAFVVGRARRRAKY